MMNDVIHIEAGLTSSEKVNKFSFDRQEDESHYPADKMIFTSNGKAAINLLFAALGLNPDDEAYITSSYGAKYVSKCVTCSVFNHCQPSKVLTPNTKIIYIIHEFGVPHPETDELIALGKAKNIPVLEDCAHTANSTFADGRRVGTKGDFSIYSLKKILPMPVGGALRINNSKYLVGATASSIKINSRNDIGAQFDKYIQFENAYSESRRKNFRKLSDAIGYTTHFNITEHLSPYVFSFIHENPAGFVAAFNRQYVEQFECVSWFGHSIVSLPVHQFINDDELNRMIEAVQSIKLQAQNR